MTQRPSPFHFSIEHLHGAFGSDATNTALTEEVQKLTRQIHERVVPQTGG